MRSEAQVGTSRWSETAMPLRVVVGLAAAVFVTGLVLEPERVWANLLLAGFYLAGIGIGSLAFVAIHHITGAGWSAVVRRVAEAIADLAPVGGVLVLAAILFGGSRIYPWWSEPHGHGFKAFWLSPGFFVGRAFAYVALWTLFIRTLRGHSVAQDEDGDLSHTWANVRWSAAWLIIFAFTVWLASVDWLMSLDPMWFSTMFGVYQFSGLFLSALAAVILATVVLRRRGALREVNGAHLHDLGKLLFAFSTFWMYIWFSQYMLIWYSNIGEETSWFAARGTGWASLMAANVVLNWVVPFTLLLQQKAKRSERRLARIAIVILVGRWIDLYLAIHPSLFGREPVFGPWEVGLGMGTVALGILVIMNRLSRAPLVPIRDPFLPESLHHHG